MTIVVWDGKNLLVDKVTTITQSDVLDKDGNMFEYYAETEHSKIYLASEFGWGAKIWGKKVKAFTMVGDTEYRRYWLDFLKDGDDVKGLIDTAMVFPHVLTSNAHYILIDEDNTLHVFNKETDRFNSNYAEKVTRPLIFGCAGAIATLNNVFTYTDNALTALECIALAQATYTILGTRFDHWNADTDKITLNNDLSLRVREMVVEKAIAKLRFHYKPNPVNIINR